MIMETHDITLYGEKVTLRPFTEADLHLAFKWNNNPAVLMAEGQEPHTWEEVVDAYNLLARWGYVFVIEAEGEAIGDVCLTWMNPDEVDIGLDEKALCIPILIGNPKHWGKGYGKDALSTVIEYSFDTLKADCLYATDIPAFNLRSLNLLKSLGFREVRQLKNNLTFDGNVYDTVDLKLRREDYIQKRDKSTK